MIVRVKVTPNAKINKITHEGDFLKIKITEKPERGRANKAVINLIAAHFGLKKSQVIIKKGEKSRNKEIELKGVNNLPNKQISLKI